MKIFFLFVFLCLPAIIVIRVAKYLFIKIYSDWKVKHYNTEQWRDIFNSIQPGDIFIKKSDWRQYQDTLKQLKEYPSIQNPWGAHNVIDIYINRVTEKKDGWVKLYNDNTCATYSISIKRLLLEYKKSYL